MRSALALSALLLLLLLLLPPPSLAQTPANQSSSDPLSKDGPSQEQLKAGIPKVSTGANAEANAGVDTGANTGVNTGADVEANADADAAKPSAAANTSAVDPSVSPGADAKLSVSADAAAPSASSDTGAAAAAAAAAAATTEADASDPGEVPAPSPSDAGKSDSVSTTGPAPTQPSSASGPDLPVEKAATTTSSSPAGPAAVSQDSDQAVHTTTPVSKTETTSSQDGGPSVSTVSATQAGDPSRQATTPPLGVNHTSSTPAAHPASTSLASNDTGTPSSVPEDGGQRTTASSVPGPVADPTSVPSGSPSASTPPGIGPVDPFPGQEQNTSQKPKDIENTTPSSGSLSPDIFQPTTTASSPEALPSTGASSDSSARFTSAVPQDVRPSPTPTVPHDRIHCDPPESFSEKMLVLNFTKAGLCDGSPHDEKLSTILCQAAKPTFNPAHDQCHIRLVPILERQALAIKEITITTNLLPQDMFPLLRDKWDALKEAGVSYMEMEKQGPPEETEDRFSMPLIITIICMASFLLLVAALYGCCHQRLSQRKDQQRLTEELQTVENGYHDNPTLEVMETSADMVEKKVVNLNGELGDSWIVPLDNLTKDDLDEEEDTHL